jgi:hypothetical protein
MYTYGVTTEVVAGRIVAHIDEESIGRKVKKKDALKHPYSKYSR